LLHSIGGSPQTPELQEGQLIPEDPGTDELGLKNEEKSLVGWGV